MRVYSLHKTNTFHDILHDHAVQTLTFDFYGVYLATSDGETIKVFYFRDFSVPIATLNESASLLMFDVSCRNLVTAHQDKLKILKV